MMMAHLKNCAIISFAGRSATFDQSVNGPRAFALPAQHHGIDVDRLNLPTAAQDKPAESGKQFCIGLYVGGLGRPEKASGVEAEAKRDGQLRRAPRIAEAKRADRQSTRLNSNH